MTLLAIGLPEIIGLTILHSLWQITLLWIVLVAVLRLWRKASSAARYILAISILLLSVVATAGTAVYEWQLYTTGEEVSVLSIGTAQIMNTVYITVKQTVLTRIANVLNASLPVLAWIWCAGLFVMGTRFAGSFFYLRTLRAHKNIAATPSVYKQELRRLSRALGLRCDVEIATSARISSPLTLGSVSPIILLPAGLLSGLSTVQIEAILVHELFHIKRRDYIINICQALVEVLLFYHPAIWHINYIIREERENCCDDKTVNFCGDPITYARALTQIQEITTLSKPTLAMSATGPNAGNFSNRIKRLFHVYPNPANARSKGIFAIGFLIVYLSIVLASANVSAARPAEPEKKSMSPDYSTFSNPVSDSITASNDLNVAKAKEITPQQKSSRRGDTVRSVDKQSADTTMKERSLDKCLKQVKLLLQTASLYRFPGDRFKYSQIPADSFELRPNKVYGSMNRSRIFKSDKVDTTGYEMTKDLVLERIHTTYNGDQAIEKFNKDLAVQVFPNATNGGLNISFTPARNNSRVQMMLLDSNGKVVKEITNSTYDSVPTELHVDVGGYNKGVYVLQINVDGTKSQQRVVVE
jgi:beta-lactamase regulating signal transducer with metallopeptidase domain